MTILITGATAGIGEATAILMASKGHRLILVGRRKERLVKLADQLTKEYGIETLPITLDVRNREKVEIKLGMLPEEWSQIDLLVNNAGLASGLDPIQTGDIDDWETMVDTNIKGLLYVSRAIIPGMIRSGRGHIINIGSVAGREVYSNGNVYCATKHAVKALTEGMRMDLCGTNIRVGQIQPGAVNTEFSTVRFHGDRERAGAVYEGFKPLTAHDIAEAICYMAEAPAHVNIAELFILPTAQASATMICRRNS